MSKNPNEEDIAELFGLRRTFYLSDNFFIEMPTVRKNRNYAFITAPEHVCNEFIKLNGVTFQDMPESSRSKIYFFEILRK